MSDPARARDEFARPTTNIAGDMLTYEQMCDEIDTLRRSADAVVATWIVMVNLAGGPWTDDRTHEWNTARIAHQEALEALRGVRADHGTETPNA